MAIDVYKPGNKIRYLHYGAVMRGEVVRQARDTQLVIIRLDGPLAGSQTWIHVNSVLFGD